MVVDGGERFTCIPFQGLEESWASHKQCAEQLHEGVQKLGLSLLVKDKVCLVMCVCVCVCVCMYVFFSTHLCSFVTVKHLFLL